MSAERIVVVGFGAAAHRFVERLHHHGHRGPVTVLGAGTHPAYVRPLLPAVLTGPLPARATMLPALPGELLDVRLGTRAVRRDRARRVVVDDRGGQHPYDRLVLATGAAPHDGGLEGPGLRSLHTLDDVADPPAGEVVVVGGGARGIELAAVLAGPGAPAGPVHLVEARDRLLPEHLDDRAAAVLAGALQRRGVTLHLGRRAVARREGELVLDDATVLRAPDVVLACGTVTPDDPVDDRLTTADEAVHAIGAAAGATDVDAAWAQAEVLARRLTGVDARYRATPALVRVRVGDLEVVAAGAPAPGARTMTVSGSGGTRHARLDVDAGDRLVHAGVVGFPGAAASLARHWARGTPLPTAWLAMLLGAAPREGDGELGDDAVVCVCNTVTKGALRGAHTGGATDLDAVAARTRATTGCGTCASTVRELLARFTNEQEVDA